MANKTYTTKKLVASSEDKRAKDLYKHFFYFFLYNYFHENYSVLYKFQPTNIRLLVQELNEYLQDENPNLSQVNLILDEIFYVINIDPIFKESFFTSHKIIEEIKKDKENKNLNGIKKKVLILNKELNYKDKYLRRLQGFLSSFLLDKFFRSQYVDTKKNMDLYLNVLNCFVAEFQLSYSRKYIDYLREKFLENNRDFEKAFDIFVSLLFKQMYEYEVVFKVKLYRDFPSEKQADGFEKFRLFLKENLIYFNEECEKDNDGTIFYIKLQINSNIRDYFIISNNAKIKLFSYINHFLFEYNTFRVKLEDEIQARLARETESFEKFTITKLEYHVHPKKESVIQRFADIFSKKISTEEETLFRIENSLRYYHSFLHETEEGKKLLSLWIAYENLFRNLDEGRDTFEKIKGAISNLFTLYYVRESCDEFQAYLREKANFVEKYETNKFIEIQRYVEGKNNGIFNSIGLCAVLSNNTDREHIIKCLNMVSNNHFSVHKYQTLSNKLKRSGTGLNVLLYEELCKVERQVGWQIARVYRKRNKIVHGHGFGDLKVDQRDLVTLEYFYHLLLESLADFIVSENYKTDSVAEYIDKLKRSKEEYFKMLKNNQNTSPEFIVIPRIFV